MFDLKNDETYGYNIGFDYDDYKEKPLSKILTAIEPMATVSIVGLITDIEEGRAKNNSTYTRGILKVKDKSITFTCFGFGKDKFVEAYKVANLPVLVRLYADEINIYNNIPSISKVKDIRLLNPSVINIEDYVFSSEYPIDFMLKCIGDYVKSMKIAPLKTVSEKIFETYKDKMIYYPLSDNTHTEKGGYLQHIYNCITEVLTSKSGPKIKSTLNTNPVKVMNNEVLVTAILSYMIGVFAKYEVDSITGVITATKPNIKPREHSGYLFKKICEDIIEDGLDNPYIKTVLSCLSDSPCCDWLGNTSSETIESLKFRYIVKMEIVENQAVNNGYNHLLEDNLPMTVNILGKPVNLIKYF